MGKAFALNRNAQGAVVQPVENNSSLTGFQGSGDIVQKMTENAASPEGAAPYLQNQQTLFNIFPTLGFPEPAGADKPGGLRCRRVLRAAYSTARTGKRTVSSNRLGFSRKKPERRRPGEHAPWYARSRLRRDA